MISTKERIHWADICKGLLITLLMFSHMVWASKSQFHIDNQIINVFQNISRIWGCFFMSCFFMITGLLSNFNKPFILFVKANFKSLIVPAFVFVAIFYLPKLDFSYILKQYFLFGGGLWFLPSLFLSKILLWACIKYVKHEWLVLTVLVFLSFLGKLLDDLDFFPNFWFHRNFLNFCLYLGFGYYFKDFILKRMTGIIAIMAYVITIIFLCVSGTNIPSVVSVFNESLLQHPLTIWLSITGSITCIHICKIIGKCKVLEYLGQNSLIVYIYHMTFLSHIISVVLKSLEDNGAINSFLVLFMIISSTLVLCSGLAACINTRWLRWMKGSF